MGTIFVTLHLFDEEYRS